MSVDVAGRFNLQNKNFGICSNNPCRHFRNAVKIFLLSILRRNYFVYNAIYFTVNMLLFWNA